jgi:O-acetyl-ADP-ribose deacetylase (regulator of RNase III)
MNHTEFEVTLIDPNPALCEQFQVYFRDFNSVSVVCDVFQSLPAYDCMVSAANSFGLMDGGVDLAIVNFFGIELMDRVQDHILNHFRGEQPIGTSFIVSTGHERHPFLAHTPTMRVPMRISATDNVYQSMWAMLLAVWKHNQHSDRKINHIACPGLGTATGGVPAQSAARQMSLAYRNFLSPPEAISWPYATTRQQAIGLGGDDGFLKLLSNSQE